MDREAMNFTGSCHSWWQSRGEHCPGWSSLGQVPGTEAALAGGPAGDFAGRAILSSRGAKALACPLPALEPRGQRAGKGHSRTPARGTSSQQPRAGPALLLPHGLLQALLMPLVTPLTSAGWSDPASSFIAPGSSPYRSHSSFSPRSKRSSSGCGNFVMGGPQNFIFYLYSFPQISVLLAQAIPSVLVS